MNELIKVTYDNDRRSCRLGSCTIFWKSRPLTKTGFPECASMASPRVRTSTRSKMSKFKSREDAR